MGVYADRLGLSVAVLEGVHILRRSETADGRSGVPVHSGVLEGYERSVGVEDRLEELRAQVHI